MLSNKEQQKQRLLSKGLSEKLYLTYKCNDNCIFCYDGAKRKALPDLPLEEAKSLVVKFEKEGRNLISLGGSEPTLYPYLLELIEFIKNLDLKFRMASNLRKCSDKNFAEKLVENGLVNVYTSLHGHNAVLHDKITRVNESFESRIKGMKNLMALGVKIETNTTITLLNFRYLKTIAEFIRRNFEPFRMRFAFLWCKANVLDNPKGIIPRIPDIRPYLKEAMDYLQTEGPYAFIEKAPICLLPEYWKDFKSEDYMLKENIKPSICRSCKFYNDDNCIGISPVYLSLYDESDLIPQKRKKWLFF